MPRYGCVAIIWKKARDPLIKYFTNCNHRMKCIKMKGKPPPLIISVYLPCKGRHESITEF